MRLALSLPVLVLVLSMVLEGPAPAQAAPDILEMLKEFGNTLENKAREAIEHIKQKDIATKTGAWFKETFQKMKEKFTES
uniref:Apolipoprotein C1 n=1 Tax=Microcebus murinus TaxID=30608 RepID=A0A8C5YEG8_MICMU